MMDIIQIQSGSDLKLADTAVPKAVNIASVQLGSLTYAPTFGVDLDYFLNSDFIFQNSSFKAYIVQRLAEFNVNVSDVIQSINPLYETYLYKVQDNDPQIEKGALIL
jgi:hypothetical protein